jgi:hypothetical protein
MKKTNKTTPSRAPATSSESPPAAKPPRAPRVLKPLALVATPASAAPPARPARPSTTVINARIDVGYGNTLYIRGEGAGLSWDVGLSLNCAAAGLWTLALPAAGRPVTFKFLINDREWSAGENLMVAPGVTATFEPAF